MALAVMPFGLAFGIAATDAGLSVWQASGFSLVVFAGSAQFASVEILADGGTAASAVVAGLLLNVRSLAFGVVMAPALQGPWWKRMAWSQLMIDETTAIGSSQADPRWRRYAYLWTGTVLFVTWNLSTLVGASLLSSAGDLVTDLGIDSAIPAAFLALVWPRLVRPDQRRTALVGSVIALALVPIAPPGLPILAASLGILAGWRQKSAAADAQATAPVDEGDDDDDHPATSGQVGAPAGSGGASA